MEYWLILSSSGAGDDVEVPSHAILIQLWEEMRVWQNIISREAEQYAGDSLLAHQDELKQLSLLMEKWTNISFQLFSRHQNSSTSNGTPSKSAAVMADSIMKQRQRMLSIMQALNTKLAVYNARIRGESGTIPLSVQSSCILQTKRNNILRNTYNYVVTVL